MLASVSTHEVRTPSGLEVVGKVADVIKVEPVPVASGAFEILGQALIQPEGEVAHFLVEEGVRGLVAQVLVEPIVLVRVDDAPLPLRQEEGTTGRQLRIVEGKKW